MKKILSAILFTLFTILIVASCGKDNPKPDNETPLNITVLETSVPKISGTICGTDQDNILQLTSGTTLGLKMQLKGGQNLSQYKIDIHANFDCHGHERPLSEWQFLKVENISGKELTVTENIPVPEDVFAGNYHCMIRLIDEEGNEASFVEFNLVVQNATDSEAPIITIVQPATDSITSTRGSIITFQGNVTDNTSLQNGKLEITYVDASGGDYTAIIEHFSNQEHTNASYNRTYEIPSFAAIGVANFTLKATDKFNNISQKQIKVNITN